MWLPQAPTTIAYGTDPAQRLDLYLPKSAKAVPLVVFVHGGAWQGGSRRAYDGVAGRLRDQGLATATVDYRLSPTVRHPAHAADVARAIYWLRASAKRYGYDPKRVFVVGHSAGGHIAGMLATDAKMLALSRPAGFVGLEGIYDVPALADRWPTYPGWFLNGAFGSNRSLWPSASPTRRKVLSRAPWLLVHSKGDELVDMGQTDGFAAHLRASGVRVEVLRPSGLTHDGVVRGLGTPGDAVAKAIVAFVKRR